jgi:hypothetical protein
MAVKKPAKETKAVKVPKAAKAAKAAEKPKAAVASKAPAISVELLEKEIRAEAQKVYEARRAKNEPGDEVSDWIKAEVVIKKKYKL